MNTREEYRECKNAECPYRSPAFGSTGKRSGYCTVVRTMVAFCCPGTSGPIRI